MYDISSVSSSTDSHFYRFACGVVVPLAVLSTSLLRSYHQVHEVGLDVDALFRGGLFGTPLFLLVLAVGALHLISRRRGHDLFRPMDEAIAEEIRAHPRLPSLWPILLALIFEKWITVWAYQRLSIALDASGPAAELADHRFRFLSGCVLLGVCLFLLPVMRQTRPRLLRVLEWNRLPVAVLVTGAALAATLAAAWLVSLSAARDSLTEITWSIGHFPEGVVATAIAGQGMRAASEELFFRGLLQITLIRVLIEAGMSEGRPVRVLGILVISAGFSLEHLAAAFSSDDALRSLLFVFSMSAALGILLEVSRSLYLAFFAHAVINLLLSELIPLPLLDDGRNVLGANALVAIFLLLVFVGVTLLHAIRTRR